MTMPTTDDAPARALFAVDRLSGFLRERWPKENIPDPVEFAIAKLALLPPGEGAAMRCQSGSCTETATHRIFVERAVAALHLKYNGKPSQENYDEGHRRSAFTCAAHLDALRDAFVAQLFSVTVTAL
jgi:hypothetical protein